ncbi:hypothetical protein [Luteolibacter sp. LG18]|uniref:hypothetical protein n=1 Tax=Luteolibacter sp. LG18 TaxID=2819286 RepID=UPI0030C6C53A
MRVAVVGLRIFSWAIIGPITMMGLVPLVGLFLFGPTDPSHPWWLLDASALIVLLPILIGFSMQTFADGLEQAHRHHGGITDAVRWWKFATTAANWGMWISLGLVVTGLRELVSGGRYDPAAIGVWIGHLALFTGAIFLWRWLKRRFREEFALRPLASPIRSRGEAPPMIRKHVKPSGDPKEE